MDDDETSVEGRILKVDANERDRIARRSKEKSRKARPTWEILVECVGKRRIHQGTSRAGYDGNATPSAKLRTCAHAGKRGSSVRSSFST